MGSWWSHDFYDSAGQAYVDSISSYSQKLSEIPGFDCILCTNSAFLVVPVTPSLHSFPAVPLLSVYMLSLALHCTSPWMRNFWSAFPNSSNPCFGTELFVFIFSTQTYLPICSQFLFPFWLKGWYSWIFCHSDNCFSVNVPFFFTYCQG